ncbi:regulatory protein RecX [Haloflavibacter putidus]|uniref:Regulatory protein RecX n=1 Tax=Haloflavibacter putidus TaxID=2576776 RepID=A0A507ZMU8_9FLAO|nr:regulatory protein RecX [Haloflavibacter putidus]TQD38599.1 RecX family transcriptional regulator [Haloflavibacter putidus]
MAYCAYQERCHQEVEEKLIALRMIPEARAQIINTLLQEDFLNEERFARTFVRGKFRIKKWGRLRIKRELKKRNLSAYNIKYGMTEINDEEYSQNLDDLFQKRLNSITEKNLYKRKKKVADYLLYRGYESNLVYEKLQEIDN